MANDVTIVVKVKDDSASGLRAARTSAEREGAAAGQSFTQALSSAVSGSGLSAAFGEVGAALAAPVSSVGALAATFASIPGAVTGAVGAMTNLANVALLLPGAFSVAAAAVAAFQIGVGGVMDTIASGIANHDHPSPGGGGGGNQAATKIANAKAIRSAQDQIVSSNQAVTKANQQLDASERAVAAAERGVVTAERAVVDAKHQVVTATQSYNDSLHAEAEAQQAVKDARAAAARQLQDSIEAVKDAALGQLGADIALARAQQNLIDTQRNVKHTALDLRDAQYQVQVAQDGVSDAATTATRATEDNNIAQAKGVDHADNVVSANDALHSSQEAVASSAYAVTQAQQGVATANQGVLDAQQAVSDANQHLVDSQQNVADAQHKAAEAVQNLSDTLASQAAAAAAGSASVRAFAQNLALLSPEAQKFVKTILELRPAWNAVASTIQDNLFRGLSDDVRSLATIYFPVLEKGLGRIATAMNGMAQYAAKALMSPENVAAVNNILGNTRTLIDNAKTALGDFITGFLGLSSIGSDYLPAIGKWLADIARSFKDWVSANPDKIRGFIQDGIQAFHDMYDILGNVIDFFAVLFQGSSEKGKGFLGTLKDITAAMVTWAPFIRDVLIPLLGALWLTSKAVAFGKSIKGVYDAIKSLGPIAEKMAPKIAALFRSPVGKGVGIAAALGLGAIAADAILPQNTPEQSKLGQKPLAGAANYVDHSRDELKGIADAIKDPATALQSLKDQFAAFPGEFDKSPFMDFWRGFPGWFKSVWDGAGANIKASWADLTGNVTASAHDLAGNVSASWSDLTGWVKTRISDAAGWVGARIGDIQGFFAGMIGWFRGLDVFGWLSARISDAAGWVSGRIGDIQNMVGGMINWFRGLDPWGWIVNGIHGAVNGAIGGLNRLIQGVNQAIAGLNAINPFGQIGGVPYIPYFAHGGVSGGGLAMVGEQGRELVKLPSGSTVVPHGQTEAMLAGRGGGNGGVVSIEIRNGGGNTGSMADLFHQQLRTGQIQLVVNNGRVAVG